MKTMTTRLTPFCGTIALLAQVFVFQGCGGSNSPAGGTGGSSATGTGGTTTTGTGGTTTTGTGGTTTTGTGGTTTTGTGGTTTTGVGGGSGTFGMPACTGVTAAGVAVKKGGVCAATDPQMCFNTCGPEKTGAKLETCTGGVYAEMSCAFDPSRDFTCYKIPTTVPAVCPATAIVSGSACSIPDCTVCGGTTGYIDSTNSTKTGYCVCQAAAANPTWSCASNTAWPCPNGTGCGT